MKRLPSTTPVATRASKKRTRVTSPIRSELTKIGSKEEDSALNVPGPVTREDKESEVGEPTRSNNSKEDSTPILRLFS